MSLKIRFQSRARTAACLTLALAFFALAAGCSQDSKSINSTETANSNSAPSNGATSNTPQPANTPSTASTPPSTPKPASLSPTEAVKGYYEAGVKGDIAGVKRFLSRGSLQMMEDIAKREGKTLDQLFSEAANMDARRPPPVFSNEKILGDTATVDIEIPGKLPLRMPLVKEGGEWKLVFGKPKSGAVKRGS